MKAQQEARLLVAVLEDTGRPAHQNPASAGNSYRLTVTIVALIFGRSS